MSLSMLGWIIGPEDDDADFEGDLFEVPIISGLSSKRRRKEIPQGKRNMSRSMPGWMTVPRTTMRISRAICSGDGEEH